MLKQPAWAAAISSSGLVPGPSSKRVLKPYWVSDKAPLWVEIFPLPSFKLPFQTADAVRFMWVLLTFKPVVRRAAMEGAVEHGRHLRAREPDGRRCIAPRLPKVPVRASGRFRQWRSAEKIYECR